MANTLINSVSFTVLLVVLVMASTGVLKSDAADLECYNKNALQCPLLANRAFLGECGPAPFTEGNCECCKCCMRTYGSWPTGTSVCWAVVEGSDNDCHCYKKISLSLAHAHETSNDTISFSLSLSIASKMVKPELEYLKEKRNLQDLWKAAFPVGTEWHNLDAVYQYNWDFKNLEEALEEGGILYGKKVYVFGIAEPQHVPSIDKFIHVPTVVAIESPFPPSDKIGIKLVQREVEDIVPMKQMKMAWVPYVPFEKRDRQVDRMNFQVFTLACTQRRVALRHLKEDRVKMFEYSIPYFYQPFSEDEFERNTEEFIDEMIEDEELPAEQRNEFKEFVKEQVRAAKKARGEAKDARMEAIEEMSEETKQAFQNIKFYKFYPQASPDVPRFLKTDKINRYYGSAHQVL
ncbi:unnamed protein product [Microthlaspi erraticum]|uniref:Uncharacterized protein n=1 Tax=Microthlaspi erraticum TaxID=1685480 RepID=A0A6D2KLI3_9BRAS|nr:unnamed protein product [Microthlaspi erraticum]